MLGHEIDHAYDTIATSHTHIHRHTVSTAFVDGHQVFLAVEGVVHHLRRNQVVLAQELHLVTLQHRRVIRQLHIAAPQHIDVLFQQEIPLSQLFVRLRQSEELRHLARPLIHLAYYAVSR